MKYFKEKYNWEASFDFDPGKLGIDGFILWKAERLADVEVTAYIYVPIDGGWEACSHLARIYNPNSTENFEEITEEEAARLILFGLTGVEDEECEDEIL